MQFCEWVDRQPRGVLKKIERATGVGYSTLHRAKSGEPLSRFDVAQKISDATGGEVSVRELCGQPDHGPTVPRSEAAQ